jgi:hypothetical protein
VEKFYPDDEEDFIWNLERKRQRRFIHSRYLHLHLHPSTWSHIADSGKAKSLINL